MVIMKFQFRYRNLGRKKKTTAKGKRRIGTNRRTQQSKQPNVNSSEATSTRTSNENANMQENHSRNQESGKGANKKGLESELRIKTALTISHEKFENQSKANASSETQGRSVGPGEKARQKFSSTGGKVFGYRLSPDHV